MKVIGNKIILDNGTEIEIDPEPPKNPVVRMIKCPKHNLLYSNKYAMCYLCSREIKKK